MSIVAAAEAPNAVQVALFASFMLAIGIALARWAGVFVAANVKGPARWEMGDRLGGLFIVSVVGMAVWFVGQSALANLFVVTRGGQGTTRPMDTLTAEDWATLSTVPGLIALAALVLGDRLLGHGTIQRLGYGLRELFHGPWPAFIGEAVVIPLLFALSSITDLIYRLTGYEHPEAHDLLLKMSQVDGGWGRWGLLLGAVVVAPLFEELFFRGHLQTLLAAFFDRLAKPADRPEGYPVIGIEAQPAIPMAHSAGRAWPRWAAIVTTALLFTAVHAAWTAPLIFLLAIAFGYAYERTGNLWVSILMHALFNGMSTALYLNMNP